MSEQDGFTTEGFKPFPSLYVDNDQVRDFADWTTDALNNRVAQYTDFIKDSELPHHISVARRIIDHAIWELSYREGMYGK